MLCAIYSRLMIAELVPEHKTGMEAIGTTLFAVAVLHTFCAGKILKFSHYFPNGSIRENLLHLLGEIEVVFGFWAAILISFWMWSYGYESAVGYLNSINFTEAIFVFVIMAIAATRPIISFANFGINLISSLLPVKYPIGVFVSSLIVGPLIGSIITEPAAMTVTALIIKDKFYEKGMSAKFMYATLGVLFVNISIGGTLTHFAAPPVLMVANTWDWDTGFMISHFGWKAAIAVAANAILLAWFFRKELAQSSIKNEANWKTSFPISDRWMAFTHLLFLSGVVFFSHHIVLIVSIFLFFLGWHTATTEHQDQLRLKESLLVGFFLAGLVTLGNLQGWWLKPLLSGMGDQQLFWGATALTAITDNAALTYLASLVPNISEAAKYYVVAGAVTGGGLTVIANAPNLAGFSILQSSFKDSISPLWLFLSAIIPTLIAASCFLFF